MSALLASFGDCFDCVESLTAEEGGDFTRVAVFLGGTRTQQRNSGS